jgi:DNA ligase-1
MISECPKTTDKKALLESFMEDKNFCTVLRFALDPQMHFKIKKLPEASENIFSAAAQFNEREVFSALKTFASQRGVSNKEKQELADAINKVPGAREIVKRIIKKDLRCGVKTALVNSVVPGFIQLWPYMRCKSHSEKNFEKIEYPAIAQLKANGTHIDIVFNGKELTFHSRIGNRYDFLGVLDKEAFELFDNGKITGVFIGEGIVLDENGKILDRKTGNGIITKALHGTITKEEASRIRIQLWEYVSYETFFGLTEGVCYFESLNFLENQVNKYKPGKISVIEYDFVENYEEVLSYYKDVKERELEGLVVKNFFGKFKSTNSGSPNQVKVKAVLGEEFEAEFEIVGINPGKEGTRFENGVGSLQYTSKCGRVVGNVGSGFSHEERDSWRAEDVCGEIATIRFDEIIQDKRDNSKYSLYAPRFIEFRVDKHEADTLEYIQDLVKEG